MDMERAERILSLRESGCSHRQISERLGIGRGTIDKVLKRKLAVKFHSANPYQLSNREVEVAKLLIEGKSIKLIAEALEISARTVDTHVGMIYIKLGVNNDSSVCKRTVVVMKLKDLV